MQDNSTEAISTTESDFNPFLEGSWKSEPSEPIVAAIEEDKTVEKPNTEEQPTTQLVEEIKPEIKEAIVEEHRFANEESERIFNLLKEGKSDEVLTILGEQKKLSTADKLPAADIIKLSLQYQNKDFSEQEIKDLFEETYSFPDKPEQLLSETDDEFEERENKYKASVEKIENRIKRDAKPASAELLKLAKEIKLPDIQRQEVFADEPTQEELDAQKVRAEKFLKSVDDSLNIFNGYQTKFKDEEVELTVSYKMTNEEKEALKPLITLSETNGVEFLKKIGWLDENGQISSAKLAEDLPFILDKTKVLQKMVNETGTQRKAASIKSIKNIDFGGKQSTGGDLGANNEQLQKNMVTHFFEM